MREKINIKKTNLKWIVMFALVFALSIPAAVMACETSSSTYRVSVATGYLALRTAKAYDSSNEIGELYTGDIVNVSDCSDPQYWWVYSPKHGTYGYVNKDYLVSTGTATNNNNYTYTNQGSGTYSVKVATGYLALRTAMAYDSRNEIGELYTGDVVNLINTGNGTYWWVFSPKHGTSGYVNSNYLVGSSSAPAYHAAPATTGTKTVRVATGYLALRTAMAYDSSNEIGELYTGDVVQVVSCTSNQYWWVYSPKHGTYGYVNCNYLY